MILKLAKNYLTKKPDAVKRLVFALFSYCMVDIFTPHFRVQNEATLPAILKNFTLPYSIPKLSEWEIKEKVLDFVVKSSTFCWSEWRDSNLLERILWCFMFSFVVRKSKE